MVGMNVKQDQLKVSPSFIIGLIKSGELPYVNIDGVEKIRAHDLAEYIERNLQKYTPPVKLKDLPEEKQKD